MKVSYFTKLSGTSFRQDQIKMLKKGTPLRCVARPENEYDSYAVEVQALLKDGWEQIGWIQKGKNVEIQKQILDGLEVKISLSEVTGVDKETLGVNVAIEYGDDSGLDPIDMRDFEEQKVLIGDSNFVFFDTVNHKAYDEYGHELISGSNVEKQFAPTFDPKYPAKAIAKKTGTLEDDIVAVWENKGDLAAGYGTLIHSALEKYLSYAPVLRQIDENQEREHTAKNWMPEPVGEIVDEFVKASGIKECKNVECRIKFGMRTGIVDLLILDDKEFTLFDYKIMPEVKEVKYDIFGKQRKYTVQQNFYREILEDNGYKCKGMFLWNWDGKKWNKIEIEKVDVKEYL